MFLVPVVLRNTQGTPVDAAEQSALESLRIVYPETTTFPRLACWLAGIRYI